MSAKAAEAVGFASGNGDPDDDLGRSGSVQIAAPRTFSGLSRWSYRRYRRGVLHRSIMLARNGRDLATISSTCARLPAHWLFIRMAPMFVESVNDRLLLGLKGTMSEYELSLMRQRGIAARDFEGETRRVPVRMLPPGLCWSEAGKIEIDPDQHV